MKSTDVIDNYRELLSERKTLGRQLKKKKLRYMRIGRDIEAHNETITILTETSRAIHKETIERIESVVTLAIRYVYDRPFEFRILLDEKRKNIEARMVVMEGEHEFSIKDELGGGIVDIISFALRIVLWNIQSPKTRNLFFIDEPFKWTGVYIEKAGQMLRYLAKELGLQIVLITHDDALMEVCDRVYRISHNGTESEVKLIKQRTLRRRRGQK
jgi:DNA repair exonuclease SbcCD ATPase subunit